MHWEQGKAGQFPPGDSDPLSWFWPVYLPSMYPGNAACPDHTPYGLCEVQQAASRIDAAGLPLSPRKGLTPGFTLPELCTAENPLVYQTH